jgi:hypothetical protein
VRLSPAGPRPRQEDVQALAELLLRLRVAARHRGSVPSPAPHDGRFGLPADFLIGPGGRILALKYGQHASDHWPGGQPAKRSW